MVKKVKIKTKRYFVDTRSGIIAVRDRFYTDPDYNGLHNDTPGVVKAWTGKYNADDCFWELDHDQILAAQDYCNKCNQGYVPKTNLGKLYICPTCGDKINWNYYPTEHGECFNCDLKFEPDDFV